MNMDVLPTGGGTVALLGSAGIDTFNRGNKFFELSNHLGNVLVTVSDRKFGQSPVNNLYTSFTADVVSATDYAPFGMQMVGRTFDAAGATAYRYGFNGKENDPETSGDGNQYDYGFRIYNPRVGRFLSVDPLMKEYPWYTPYQFAGNIPISKIDLEGLEEVSPSINYNPITGLGSASYPALKASEWKDVDRSSASGTFASAARYNTSNLNSSLYKPITQIHQYYVWSSKEIDKTKANIKFFHAASDVTGLTGVDGAVTFPSISGLSEHGQKSLIDVNSRLLKENMPVIRDILDNRMSSVVNGKGIIWDFNYVNREQSIVASVISKDPLSQGDAMAINRNFSRFEYLHPEYSMAKSLIGVDRLDYRNQDHREAIGRSLVFIKHFLDDNNFEKTKETKEYKAALEFLNKRYGEKNTKNFIHKYRERLGQ